MTDQNDDVIDGEVVGEYSGDTLLNLPHIEDEYEDDDPVAPPPVSPPEQPADQGRRGL
ncbi:MAG: hypothetical protein ACFB51_07040 [Anaerolineae bacterium]